MGACISSDKVVPLEHEVANCAIVEKRTATDTTFLITFILFLFGLVGLLSYCVYYGDVYRIINGYDDCGNVCGRFNSFEAVSGCTGNNMTEQTFLIVKSTGTITFDSGQVNRKCATQCPDDSLVLLNRCLPGSSEKQANKFFSKTGIREFFQEVNEDITTCSNEIIYMFIIAFVASVVILLLFRYSADIVVWFVLFAVVFICIVGTILLWGQYLVEQQANRPSDIGKRRVSTLMVLAIIATILTIGVSLVILVLRKRIQLVIRLFKEAGKVVTKMPLLLFEPILTFAFLVLILSLWLYFSVWIESAGFLTIENTTSAEYVKDGTIKFTRWYNIMAMLWCTQFVVACQHIVIAGAAATWFFTRNKNELDAPITNSFDRLIRYHLGTAACGSLLIAIVQFFRVILDVIQYTTRDTSTRANQCISSCGATCLGCIEKCLKYISRQAYIETAIHGYPFFTAGRIAFTRLSANALRVLVINSIGDFVLFLGKAAVVVLTVVTGMEMMKTKENVHHLWMLLLLGGVFAYLVAHTFISVYEMIIDTIFMCFCEDYEHNDGMSRPYYMSQGLMEFVETSKTVMDKNTPSIA